MTSKIISTTVKETPFLKTTTIKKEHECWCFEEYNPLIKYGSHVLQDHNNCMCSEKYDIFAKKYPDLNSVAIQKLFFAQTDFGPCVKCKGTGLQISTYITKNKKYLCINGPLQGKRFTTNDIEATEYEYQIFNNGSSGSKNFAAIWVYCESLLEPGDPQSSIK